MRAPDATRTVAGGLLALGAATLLAACGGDVQPADNPPAAKVESRVILSGNIPHARPADFRGPTEIYRRHVRSELAAMRGDVGELHAAAARGDLDAARAAWLRADAHYETIGAAYGAFGDLDAAINGRTAGLPGGVDSPDFTGLHRVELALWQRDSTQDAVAPAAQLDRDVARLRAHVGRMEIDPLEYSLRVHEVLEDTLHLQLSGQASPWSGAALGALDANVRGTEVVLDSLRPLVRRRAPLVLQRADRALATLRGELATLRRPDSGFPRWDALDQRERERIGGYTAAAAEQLAYMPGLVDPRPARPVQRAFGTEDR